jgi:anti-sigma B factor antagonist
VVSSGRKKIILNLSGVSYSDSSGNGELVSGYTTVRNMGGSLVLVNLTKRFKDLLQITKLYTVFEVFDDEATAIRSLKGSPLHCLCPSAALAVHRPC